MKGANFKKAKFSKATSFKTADISNATWQEVDLSMLTLTAEQIASSFGDASVILPNGITPNSPDWPAHWPKQILDWGDFKMERHKLQANPETYTPP